MNRDKAISLATFVLAACVGPTSTVGPARSEASNEAPGPKPPPVAQVEPAQVEPAHAGPAHAEPEPIEAEATQPHVPSTPTLERRSEHLVVVAPHAIEDAVVVPGGVAFVQHDEIWLASPDSDEVRLLEDPIDPHGLARVGSWLYWLGNEKNGRIELSTAKKERIPRFAPPGRQSNFAAGDKLYGITDEGQVWGLEGMHISRVETHADRQWRSLPGHFGAGAKVLVLPVLDPAEREAFLWRVRVGGKGQRVETNRVVPALWSINAKGSLAFVRGDEVFRLGAKSNKPRRLFEEPDVSALCWCGDAVCTFVASESELRIHGKDRTEVRPLTAGLEQPSRTTCSAEYVAWRVSGEARATMGVLAL